MAGAIERRHQIGQQQQHQQEQEQIADNAQNGRLLVRWQRFKRVLEKRHGDDNSRFFQPLLRRFGPVSGIDEACLINDCPAPKLSLKTFPEPF
jgi:hypothetical protein